MVTWEDEPITSNEAEASNEDHDQEFYRIVV